MDAAELSSERAWSPLEGVRELVVWASLIFFLVAMELWGHPLLAAACACLKFGWNEFATAIWVGRDRP